jgi:hypothetical protein
MPNYHQPSLERLDLDQGCRSLLHRTRDGIFMQKNQAFTPAKRPALTKVYLGVS